MRLLIKQCYSGSYIEDEEGLLDRNTRMRLAFWGNAFEMKGRVWECLGSLMDGMTFADTLTTLDDVPEELQGHVAMPSVIAKVVEVIADMLERWTQSHQPSIIQ